MNTPIVFTLNEVVELLLWMCTAIVSVAAAVAVIVKARQKAKEPEKKQDERIQALEDEMAKFRQFFDNDNKRLVELEKGNRVTQRALLALLSHAINGNNDTELKDAEKMLRNYLIGRGDYYETSKQSV